ncbi:MAG: AI-2E family transporter [Acidobacteriota bacterium]|nr:AI-2E family transporter [Acidobacteriota bacterium]
MPPQTPRERLSILFFYAAVLWLGYILFRIFQPFLVPLGWAAVMVVFFHPLHTRFERRWGPGRAALASTFVVTIIVVVPMILVVTAFVREGIQAAGDMQRTLTSGHFEWVQSAWHWLEVHTPIAAGVDFPTMIGEGAKQAAATLASSAGALLQNVVVFVFDLFVSLFAVFFLFRDSHGLMQGIRRVLPFEDRLRERMIGQARDLVAAGVSTSLAVASVQGGLGGLAFAALGIDAPVFWGVVMAFFCVLPLGAWVVWMPAAIWLMATDHVVKGIVLFGVGVGIVSLADNFLRPLLLSGRAQMNGLLVFISLLGGMAVFGVLGLVLGPVLVATAVAIVDAYTSSE